MSRVKKGNHTIGGFENEQGKKIVEVSTKVHVKTSGFDQAVRLAALIGANAPETRESTTAAIRALTGIGE